MLTTGITVSVSVKYKNDQAISCTPLLIMCNSPLSIMHMPAFNSTLVSYYWTEQERLKQLKKRFHPLAFIDLLNT